MGLNSKPHKKEGNLLPDPTIYIRLVGSPHLTAVHWILPYLNHDESQVAHFYNLLGPQVNMGLSIRTESQQLRRRLDKRQPGLCVTLQETYDN